MAHRFRDLIIWQRSMQLVVDIYTATRDFPREELFGITSQLRRAIVSVPLNIAEESGSESTKEFSRFLNIALRSLNETITALEISLSLDYISSQQSQVLIGEAEQISSMIVAFSQRIQHQSNIKSIRENNIEYFTNNNVPE